MRKVGLPFLGILNYTVFLQIMSITLHYFSATAHSIESFTFASQLSFVAPPDTQRPPLFSSIPTMSASAHARSLYRQVLRELPPRIPITAPSSLRSSIRKHFSSPPASSAPEQYTLARRQEAEQFIAYLKAQRIYGALLERYNPGMGMDEEERVRLSARRVGMNLPVEWKIGGK